MPVEITEEMVSKFADVYYGGNVPHLMAEIRAALCAALSQAAEQPWKAGETVRLMVDGGYFDTAYPVSPPCDSRTEALEEEVWRLQEALKHAPDPRHFDILAEAMSEVKATSDGESDQPISDIVAGCLAEIDALSEAGRSALKEEGQP
jgi:hypothetical protein